MLFHSVNYNSVFQRITIIYALLSSQCRTKILKKPEFWSTEHKYLFRHNRVWEKPKGYRNEKQYGILWTFIRDNWKVSVTSEHQWVWRQNISECDVRTSVSVTSEHPWVWRQNISECDVRTSVSVTSEIRECDVRTSSSQEDQLVSRRPRGWWHRQI